MAAAEADFIVNRGVVSLYLFVVFLRVFLRVIVVFFKSDHCITVSFSVHTVIFGAATYFLSCDFLPVVSIRPISTRGHEL